MDITTPEYKDAFRQYLRRGTPIELSLKNRGKLKRINKQKRTTTHYIWRTQGDGKVRESHAANNGKVFAWDNPPPTGHPGEDFGCRCIAEPYVPEIEESFEIKFHGIEDSFSKWGSAEFAAYYWVGLGKPIQLRKTGNLSAIADEYRRLVIDDITRLPSQIAQKARLKASGKINGDFERNYPMKDIVYAIGSATIGGSYSARCRTVGQCLHIDGHIDFYFKDIFQDIRGTAQQADKAGQKIGPRYGELWLSSRYLIWDKWKGTIRAKVASNNAHSIYRTSN